MKKWLLAALTLLLLAGAAFLLFRSREEPSAAGMNLLVITLDTTRADRIGVYGNRDARTPNLDSLARSGVRIETCYSSVPLTLPSHSTMFTGLYPVGHRVRNNGTYYLSPEAFTLAEAFQSRRYSTAAVVSAFVLLSKFGLDQGFDRYDDSLDTYKLINNYESEIAADQVYGKFRAQLEKVARHKFFLWVHFYDPHSPYAPPAEFAPKGKREPLELYDGEIAFMDKYVGAIVNDLRQRGLADRTLIVVVGDHGEAFGEHVEHGHGIFCYEESLRVPLIFCNPRLFPQGRVVREPVDLADLMPTILSLYRFEPSGGIHGQSFSPSLFGREERNKRPPRRPFYFESLYGQEDMNWAPLTGIIFENHKYISLPEPELYDLKADRGERRNIQRQKNQLARRLDRMLADFVLNHSAAKGQARRQLTAADVQHLQTLGYVSSFGEKANAADRPIDPKRGAVVDSRLKAVSRQIKEGKIAAAENDLALIRRDNPDLKMPNFYNLQYRIFSEKKDFPAAIDVLRQALVDFPKMSQFRIVLALLLYDNKHYERAESRCREILTIEPKFTRAYMLLGDIQEKRGRLGEAAASYGQACAIEPGNVSLALKYAELRLSLKDYGEVLRVYGALLENEDVSGNDELLFKIALFYSRFGPPGKAEELFGRLVGLKPGGKYFFNYALILAKNGKNGDAAAAMRKAVERFGDQLSSEQRQIAGQALDAWREVP